MALRAMVPAAVALTVAFAGAVPASAKGKRFFGLYPLGHTEEISRFSDKAIAFHSIGKIPARPPLHLEVGDGFLDTGNLFPGFTLPGGAVWQPRLWSYAFYRSAFHTFDNGSRTSPQITEWVHRLDTYTNLQLSGTERILVSFRPLDNNRFDKFTRYDFKDPGDDEGFRGEFNANLRALFIEGDFGSLLPFLDRPGMKPIDFGFTVGRQNFNFQEGALINDDLDALGIVRNNIRLPGVSNLRVSALWGWDGSDRGGGAEPENRGSPQAHVFGLFNSADMWKRTINVDGVLITDRKSNGGDAFYLGLSSIQRIGLFNTTFRALSSYALEATTPQTGTGGLLTGEISWTPHASDDNVYINPFIALGEYTQAGREPILGGPLAILGILFASPNLGDYRGELNGQTNEVFGTVIGYQAFWNEHHTNLTLELAMRKDYGNLNTDAIGTGFQVQQKIGQHIQLQFEGFISGQEDRDVGYGGRSEIQIIY